jgi:hypothetical protein
LPSDVFEAIKSCTVPDPGFVQDKDKPLRIRVFLAHNVLTRAPYTLWKFKNLTLLDLEHNRLHVLPGAISNLTSLEILNVAKNVLRWLPYQLLKLVGPGKNLKTVKLEPNPLFKPYAMGQKAEFLKTWDYWLQNFVLEKRLWHPKEVVDNCCLGRGLRVGFSFYVNGKRDTVWRLADVSEPFAYPRTDVPCEPSSPAGVGDEAKRSCYYIAATPVYHYSRFGVPQKPFDHPYDLQPWTHQVEATPYKSEHALPLPPLPGVRSLLDTALISLPSEPELLDSKQKFMDSLPRQMHPALEAAIEAQWEGGRRCDVCDRPYVIPRREWLEYWVVETHGLTELLTKPFELFWPILRRGCSPGCVRENGKPMEWLGTT